MSVSNIRQLDIWAANKNPNDIQYPLGKILERVEEKRKHGEEIEPLGVFVNCVSKFTIGDREIERYIDTLVLSKQLDVAFCIMSTRCFDEEFTETTVDIQRVVDFFYDNNIKFKASSGKPLGFKDEKTNIPETWFIREGYVLKEFLNDSRNNGCEECIIHPDIECKIVVGQYSYETGEFHEVWGVNFKGLIATKNSWGLLTNENYPNNLSTDEAIKTIEKEGFSYKVGSDPFEEVRKK